MLAAVCTVEHVRWWIQFLHPGQLRPCGGYWAWSGIISDLPEVAFLGVAYAAYKHHNCHVDGCWRTGHIDSTVEHPACKKHHALGHST